MEIIRVLTRAFYLTGTSKKSYLKKLYKLNPVQFLVQLKRLVSRMEICFKLS